LQYALPPSIFLTAERRGGDTGQQMSQQRPNRKSIRWWRTS